MEMYKNVCVQMFSALFEGGGRIEWLWTAQSKNRSSVQKDEA